MRSARLDGLVMISYASRSMESNIMRFGSHGSMTAGSGGAAGAAAAAAAGAEVLVMVGSLCEIFWHSLAGKNRRHTEKKHKLENALACVFASCFLLSSSFSRNEELSQP